MSAGGAWVTILERDDLIVRIRATTRPVRPSEGYSKTQREIQYCATGERWISVTLEADGEAAGVIELLRRVWGIG